MAYFRDLSPYAYGHAHHPGVVHVGWLDGIHSFPKGAVDSRLLEKIKLLSREPGLVIDPNCAWARWVDQRSSNGEIRVRSGNVTFAAPVLIAHYIEEHAYLPPGEFLKAVEQLAL
jgi:hypothetical protein